MMYLTERSENHASKRRFCGPSQGNFRKPCHKEALLRRILRKLPKNTAQTGTPAAYRTEDSAQGTAKRTICGSVCGRLRETNRFETTARSVMRKVPSNGAPQRQSVARRTEGSEKHTKEESRNGISYGSFRKTSHKQSAKQHFQAPIGAEYGGQRRSYPQIPNRDCTTFDTLLPSKA